MPIERLDLADRLDAVETREMNLKDRGHRSRLSVWPTFDDDMLPAMVMLQISAEWGVPSRYVAMTPDEARILARHLVETADLVDDKTEVAHVD